ncbi:glycosyltransferase family 4 protein [Kineococcus sp. G2]|uniref:glycosyltransferase family 4 protein n=1 Tax=Kineococcus sp. G2 TaxID=3127484 RepID=UPI00301CC7F1
MLVITNWRDLDHPEAGGAEVVCQELAHRFARAGEEVVLVCADVPGAPREEERDGYRIVRRGGRFTVYGHALLWLLRHRDRVDGLIDSQNGIPFFSPAVLPRTTPALMLLHHVHQDQFAKYFPAPAAAVGRWLESTGSRVVYGRRGILAVSPSTRTDARRRLGLRGEIWVTPPGWSVSEQVRTATPERTVHPSVVCLGRLVPHKRTEMVIQAFPTVLSRVPDARLTIVGRGTEGPRLRQLAADLGLADAVDFKEGLDDLQRDQVLSTAWMTVNASQGEGWGLSVVEANALGVPALAFRRPGLRDSIVDGETGWLIDDGTDLGEAVAAALDELRDEGRAHQVAQHARRWASRFTWDAMAQRVLGALESERRALALGGRNRRTSSDVSTVVTVPLTALPENWQDAVRRADAWERSGDSVSLLCRGADTQNVSRVLERLGVRDEDASRHRVSVSVARTADLLRLSSPATQGSA